MTEEAGRTEGVACTTDDLMLWGQTEGHHTLLMAGLPPDIGRNVVVSQSGQSVMRDVMSDGGRMVRGHRLPRHHQTRHHISTICDIV